MSFIAECPVVFVCDQDRQEAVPQLQKNHVFLSIFDHCNLFPVGFLQVKS